MVLNSVYFIAGILIGLAVWLGILSVLLIRTISHYNRLTKGVTNVGLTDVLDVLIRHVGRIEKRTEEAQQSIIKLIGDGRTHFRKVGIVRFNPFADTGGAQSFTMSLLDEKENGIVMTSLYARSGNRWYVKEIVAGKGKDMELSAEESASIKKARSYS